MISGTISRASTGAEQEIAPSKAVGLLLDHPNTNLKPCDCTRSYRKGFIGASSGGQNDIV